VAWRVKFDQNIIKFYSFIATAQCKCHQNNNNNNNNKIIIIIIVIIIIIIIVIVKNI